MSTVVSIVETPVTITVQDQNGISTIVVPNPTDISVISIGEQGPAGIDGIDGSSGARYVHTQSSPSTSWTITHNLAAFPSVTVVNSAEDVVYGDINYISNNVVSATFTAAFSGKAYVN